MNENKTLNDICIDFQQDFINLFNNEQNIPFVLKYYLVKDIWENIQSTKTRMDIESKQKIKLPKQQLNLQTGEVREISDEDQKEETEEM